VPFFFLFLGYLWIGDLGCIDLFGEGGRCEILCGGLVEWGLGRWEGRDCMILIRK
jgi:hypothetical protein